MEKMIKDNFEKLLVILNEEKNKNEDNLKIIKEEIDKAEKSYILLCTIIDKLKKLDNLNDEEIDFIINDLKCTIINKEPVTTILKNISFVKRFTELIKNDFNINEIFKEQYENNLELLKLLIRELELKSPMLYQRARRDVNNFNYKVVEIEKRIRIINNLIEFIYNQRDSITEDDFLYLVHILDEDLTYDDKTKKEILYDLIQIIHKTVEEKKRNLSNFNDEIEIYKANATVKELFAPDKNEHETEIKSDDDKIILSNGSADDVLLDEQTNLSDILSITKEEIEEEKPEDNTNIDLNKSKLKHMLKTIFDYIDIVYEYSDRYDVNLDCNLDKTTENLNPFFKILKSNIFLDEAENIWKMLKPLITDNYEVFKTYVFNNTLDCYGILVKDFNYILKYYDEIEDLDEFISTLNDNNKILEYIRLIADAYEYLMMEDINTEFSNLEAYYSVIIDEKKKEEKYDNTQNEENIYSNIGKNLILFAPTATIPSNVPEEFKINIKESLRMMRDKNYGFLAQKGNKNDRRVSKIKGPVAEALLNYEHIEAKRYRQSDSRIAFIPLNVSKKVQDIINEHFGYKMVNNNRIILIFGYEFKNTSDTDGYVTFNSYLGKIDRKANTSTIIKNPDIFNIIELFSKKELTREDINNIIKIVEEANSKYNQLQDDNIELKQK